MALFLGEGEKMENETKQIKSILNKMDKDEEFIITIPIISGEEDSDGTEEV